MAAETDNTTDARSSALRSLRDLLLEERSALAARDRTAVLDCAERKARQAGGVDAMLASLADLESLPAAERDTLTRLARECAELNHANGVTVAALRGVVDRALGILRGGDEQEAVVYGPAGARRAAAIGRYAGSA